MREFEEMVELEDRVTYLLHRWLRGRHPGYLWPRRPFGTALPLKPFYLDFNWT